LVGGDTNRILGITENCYKKFGINPALTYNSSLDTDVLELNQIFPAISSIKSFISEAKHHREQILDTERLCGRVYLDKHFEDLLEPIEVKEEVFTEHQVIFVAKEMNHYRYMDEPIFEVHIRSMLNYGDNPQQLKNLLGQTGQIVDEIFENKILPDDHRETKRGLTEIIDEDIIDPDYAKELAISQERERRLREKRLNFSKKSNYTPLQIFKYLGGLALLANLIISQVYLFNQLEAAEVFPKTTASSLIEGFKNEMLAMMVTESYRLELILK
jgi:hypothetical protein